MLILDYARHQIMVCLSVCGGEKQTAIKIKKCVAAKALSESLCLWFNKKAHVNCQSVVRNNL